MFGAYGDVVCVKVLKNKRDCALVQMAKPHHAQQVDIGGSPGRSGSGFRMLCQFGSRSEGYFFVTFY